MSHKLVWAVSVLFVLTIAATAPAAQFGRHPKDTTRLLTGKVVDHDDSALPNAVVYLTNSRTRAVKTYIVSQEGTYRFPALQPGIDYELYAQYNGHKSDVKSVSQFDDRTQIYVTLKIDTK